MQAVQIQEFSLSTSVEYRCPVTVGEAKLDTVAKALSLPPCGEFLNPVDITLAKQNELFSYTFSVQLFGGSGGIVINAKGITVSFKQGKSVEHLALMIKLTLAALEVAKVGEFKTTSINLNLHATFDTPSDYAEHMMRFTALAPKVVSGGSVLVMRVAEIDGEFRYASEKSLVYPEGLFIATSFTTAREANPELYKRLETEFELAASLDGILLQKT